MQEHGITHLQDGLVGGLNYAGDGIKSAEYVHSAKLVKFAAESGDRFSPQAARVLRFRLMDECWLQPGTLKLQVQLNNTTLDAATPPAAIDLTPIAQPLCMFQSARLLLNGQACESIDELPVMASIMDKLQPVSTRITRSMQHHPIKDNGEYTPLKAGRSRFLLIDLPFGLTRQHLWLPLHIISQLVVELTLAPANTAFAEANANFTLENVHMLGTCLHVDSNITMQYHNHIAMGSKLAIPFQSVIGTRHIVAGSAVDFTLALSRSLNRLKQLYFVIVESGEKIVRDFKQPIAAADADLNTDIMSFQLQCGATKFPDNFVLGAGEAYYRLMQAVGHAHDITDMSITPSKFMGTDAIFGIDLERLGAEAAFSGITTRNGKVLNLTVKNFKLSGDNAVREVFVFQVYDGIVNLRKASVDIEE